MKEKIKYYSNGFTRRKSYFLYLNFHNISNPSDVFFTPDGKIEVKDYELSNIGYSKLAWQNLIKNVYNDKHNRLLKNL
jgi:hypothetical protein